MRGNVGTIASSLAFPLTVPANEDQRIEQSLDDTLTTPYNYSFNLSYGRELGRGLSFEASYVGRFAHNLLASRDIMQLNVTTGEQHMVLHDARIGDIVFNPADRSLWGLRHLNGFVTLVRIPEPYTSWNQIHTFPFGRVPFDLDISADGRVCAINVYGRRGRHTTPAVGRRVARKSDTRCRTIQQQTRAAHKYAAAAVAG